MRWGRPEPGGVARRRVFSAKRVVELGYELIRFPDFPETLSALPRSARLPGRRLGPHFHILRTPQMPVAVGPYGQSQPSCFDRVKMGFVMGCAVGMAAGALFGTFSCLR